MKHIRITRILTALAVIVMAFVGQACSDGELQLGSSANPSISPFVSITADPMEVQSGGSTTLKWTVANAESVEIESDDGTFHAGPIDMSGKTEDQIQVDGITATTTYTITATAASIEADVSAVPTDPYIPVKSGQIVIGSEDDDSGDADIVTAATVSDSVTVTVVSSDLSINFYADDGDNMACMPRVLHWEVTPSDATITIEASTGEVVELSQTCAPVVQSETETETETETEAEENISLDDIEKSPYQVPEGLLDNLPDTKNSKAISISKSTNQTTVPATGCAVVYPCETTTYTLTATDDSGDSMSEDVTIIPGNIIIDYDNSWIKANGESPVAEVSSFPAEDVPISYQISPSMIPVTVEADKDVGCELPQNVVLAEMPETTDCDISEETVFTLVAHIGSDTIAVSQVKVIASSGSGRVDVDAQDWAFEGEEVTVTVTPRTVGDAAKIAKIRIKGTDTIERTITDTTPIVETVTVPLTGVIVEVINTADEDPVPQMAVFALPLFSASILGEQITEAMFDPHNPGRSYYGVMTNLKTEGASSFMSSAVTIHRNDDLYSDSSDQSGPIDIDIGRLILTWNDSVYANVLTDDFFIEGVKTFPVRAIATRDEEKIFAGTTGAVLYSGNSGSTWKMYGSPFYWKSETGNDYPGHHESCSGETQTGGTPLVRGSFAYYMGVCDIIVDGNRMYIATDTGVETDRDVDAILGGQMTNANIRFMPHDGDDPNNFPLFKRVVNDLELMDDGSSKKIFAAVASGTLNSAMTVNGVYVSSDEGESWAAVGSLGVDAYAVKVDMDNGEAKKIYAATADGVYARNVDSGDWEKVLDGAAYALADDPYSTGTIIAGLENGAKITRNSGNEWNWLTTGGANSSGKVSAIDMQASTDGSYVSYMVAFATEDRFLSGKVMVPATTSSDSIGSIATASVRMEAVHINQ